MLKLNAKFDADLLLYSLSHCECNGHTVHMLIQQCLPPPLTGTVKSSLFTCVHSSPVSLAVSLHACHANCSCHINNGWTFSRQALLYSEMEVMSHILLFTFPGSHQWSKVSSLSKVILVLGKARSNRAPNLGCRGAESPG